MRLTLGQLANTRIPQSLGLCSGDIPGVASFVNEATLKLINTASETGWWLGWQKVVFPITTANPFLTLPSIYSRVVNLDLCRSPVRIQNGWYEMIVDGVGLRTQCDGACGPIQALDREMVPTAFDIPDTNSLLRVYITDSRDIGKRILFSQVKDVNGVGVYSTSGVNQVDGIYLTFQTPFTTSAFVIASFLAVVKDTTFGDVVLKAVNQTSGVETLLARYGPQETNPSYRRYMLTGVPACCCISAGTCATNPPQSPQVTTMCKLDYRPVSQPSDQLLISNVVALKAACESIRYGEIDNPASQQFSILKWNDAVKALNQEIRAMEGNEFPAISVSMPWGNYRHDPMQVGQVF